MAVMHRVCKLPIQTREEELFLHMKSHAHKNFVLFKESTMVRQKKCVLGCKEKKTLYSFPTNPVLRQRWMQFIFPGQERKCEWVYVCSLHFEDHSFTNKAQFDAGFANRLQLTDEAVPTLKDSVQESEPQVIMDNSCLVSSGQLSAIKSMTRQTPEGMQAKSKSDKHHAKTTIDIGEAFLLWRTFREENGFRTDTELAFYLLKRLRGEDLSARSKKRRLEPLTDVPALQTEEGERNSSQSSHDHQSTDKDEDMEVAEICYEVPFPCQTDESAQTKLKSVVRIKLEEQARSEDQLKTEDQIKSVVRIKLEEHARSEDQLKTEDQIKSVVRIKLEEHARSEDQLKTEDQIKSVVRIKLEEHARSEDQLKTEDQIKSVVRIKLEEHARSEDQLKTEDQIKSVVRIKLEEHARSEDQLKTEDQIKSVVRIKLEEQARSGDQLKTEGQIKLEVQIKSEDQLDQDVFNGCVAPALGNGDIDPQISTSTTKKEIKEEPVETEVQPENRLEVSMDCVTTSDKITPSFVQTVNPVSVDVKEEHTEGPLVPNFTGLFRTCIRCGEPVQEYTTVSSGSLDQLQWKCSNGHRIVFFTNSNPTQTNTHLS